MSDEQGTPISVTPTVKVGDQVFVNDAAIELLASRVFGKIAKTFGVGVVGVGGIATVIAAMYWIPAQVEKIVENSKEVQDQIAGTVQSYLSDGKGKEFLEDETGRRLGEELPVAIDRQLRADEITRLVALQLPKSVEVYFAEGKGDQVLAQQVPGAVSAYIAQGPGQQVLGTRIDAYLQSAETTALLKEEIAKDTPDAVATYLSQGTGQQELERVVKAQISNANIEEIIKKTVNDVLRNTATARTESMAENRGKAITVIATPRIEKGEEDLRNFLDRPETQAAGDQGLPLAISFTVGRRYVAEIIEDHITTTMRRYPLSDIYLLLHEGDGRCLAFCGPVARRAEEVSRLRGPAGRSELVDLIDAADGRNFDRTARGLRDLDLPVITAQLPQSESLESALRSDVWTNPDNMTAPVLVVDGQERLLGTTTRGQLITALLGK